jgi:threonine aldolase
MKNSDRPILDKKSFASDNNSGVIPEVFKVLSEFNEGHVPAYGNDPVTDYARKLFVEAFGAVETFFVFNGTAANMLCLKPMLKSFEGVICADTSHLNNDECGAPEFTLRTKLMLVPSPDGKVKPEQIKSQMIRLGDPHRVQARVLSVTQPTEYGTLYTIEELKTLGAEAKKLGLYFHIDGSRLVNACAQLGVSLKEMTKDVGADAVSFGGTKNGLMLAEACVFFNRDLIKYVPFYQKQLLQLPGKCRYVAAQFIAFLENDVWLKYAKQSIGAAQYLYQSVEKVKGVKITQVPQANTVFAVIPKDKILSAREEFFFYIWNEHTNEVRWMTSWNTTRDDIDRFVNVLNRN